MGRGWTSRFCSLRDGPQLSSIFGAGRLLRCPWALAPELSMMSCPLWAGPAGSRAILGPAPTCTHPHSHSQAGEWGRAAAVLGPAGGDQEHGPRLLAQLPQCPLGSSPCTVGSQRSLAPHPRAHARVARAQPVQWVVTCF